MEGNTVSQVTIRCPPGGEGEKLTPTSPNNQKANSTWTVEQNVKGKTTQSLLQVNIG